MHVDVWRLIAVALVIIYHVTSFSSPTEISHKIPNLVWRLESLGKFGVMIFFCISGFVICKGLVEEQNSTSSISLISFYIRRTLRIFPPLLLYLFGLTILSYYGLVELPEYSIFRSATFTCNLTWMWDCGWFLGHTWSLAFEEQFYLLFPLLFMAASFSSNKQRILLTIFVCIIVALAAHFIHLEELGHYLAMFVYMLAGCAFAIFWSQLRPILEKMSIGIWLLIVMICFIFCGTVALSAYTKLVFEIIVLPFLTCLMVFGTPLSNRWISLFFEIRILSHLGKTTYTVYLWQQLATAHYPGLAVWWTIVFLVCVFIFALFSYRYLEVPLMLVGKRWTNSRHRKESLRLENG